MRKMIMPFAGTFAAVLLGFALSAAGSRAVAGVFIVISPGDVGPGTLRFEMTSANLNPGPDTILFQIPGPGPHVIMPLSPLPLLTDAAGCFIDGYSQPGAAPGANLPSTANLQIVLDGTQAGPAHGFHIVSPFNTIQGLVIRNFQQDGIRIEATPTVTHSNVIYGNFIGTNQTGTTSAGNGSNQLRPWAGVNILAPTSSNIIAQDNHVRRNLISGNYSEGVSISSCPPANVHNNHVDSNYIGTNFLGLSAIPNRVNGVYIGEAAHHNWVVRNVIAGNDTDGVCIVGYVDAMTQWFTPFNQILDNAIGVGSNWTSALPNGRHGVSIGIYGAVWFLGFAPDNTVAQNVIAYNRGSGVIVWEHFANTINADRNNITSNSIYHNGNLGIDLGNDGVTINDPGDPDTGPNEQLNVPVIHYASAGSQGIVTGHVDIGPNPTTATVEVYKAQHCPAQSGQGRTLLGIAAPDPAGNWQLQVGAALTGADTVTATVIDQQKNTSEFAVNVPANAPLIAAPPAVSFGTVALGNSATRPVTIHNPGGQPLTINATTAIPAAFTIAGGGAPLTINGGDSAVVQLRFSPSVTGAQAGTLTINSNAVNNPSLIIGLSGTGADSLSAIQTHAAALHFGSLLAGSSAIRTLRISNAGNGWLAVSAQSIGGIDAADFTIMRPSASSIAPGASDSIDIRFSPGATGSKAAALSISSNDPNLPTTAVSLAGDCVPSLAVLAVDSSSIDFGTVFTGANAERELVLRNIGNAQLAILGQSVAGPDAADFTIVRQSGPAIGASGRDSIRLRFAPLSGGSKSATLTITSNDPNNPSRSVWLKGTGTTTAPSITADPAALDFDTVAVGESETLSLVVRNTGSSMLVVNTQQISGTDAAHFSITRPCAASIAPGNWDTMRIRFLPASAGAKTAGLFISSNDPLLPVLNVAITGHAVPAAPAIILAPAILDFDTVLTGNSATRRLLVSNTGNAALQIIGQSISGADSARFAITRPAGAVIPPGNTDTITLVFLPTSPGAKSASLRIVSNDPAAPDTAVGLAGFCVATAPAINAIPVSLDFDTVAVGGSSTKIVIISNNGTAALSISAQTITGAHSAMFAIMRPCAASLPPGASDTIEARFSPSSTGAKTAAISVASNDPQRPDAQIPLSGYASAAAGPDIEVTPASLSFGSVAIGAMKTLSVFVANNGTAQLVISKQEITGIDAAVFVIQTQVSSTIAPGGRDTLRIAFSPAVPGARNAQLRVHSNDPASPIVSIALSGSAPPKSGASIAVTPAALDFGITPLNAPVSKTLRITNTGDATLQISAQGLRGADSASFSFARFAANTVAPGGNDSIIIRFQPTSYGPKTARLLINSNDSTRPTVTVNLNGSCATGSGARIAVDRAIIDFGTVPLLTTKDEDVVISNTGTADLAIQQQLFYGPDASMFTFMRLAGTPIKPGESSTARIRFTPVASGARSAFYRIQSNDPVSTLLDIQVAGTTLGSDSPGGAGAMFVLGEAYPNPFSAGAGIPLDLPAAGDALVRILDGLGRVVRVLSYGRMEAGAHTLVWDGRDAAGVRVPPGVYRCIVDLGGHRRSASLVCLPAR